MTIAQQLGVKEFPFTIRDGRGNLIYFENSNKHWEIREFNSKGKEIYYEDSKGTCVSYSPKFITELTLDQIADKFNIPVSSLKIKK